LSADSGSGLPEATRTTKTTVMENGGGRYTPPPPASLRLIQVKALRPHSCSIQYPLSCPERISPEGGSVMDNRPSVSSPTSRYDDFLFASICEEANGMRLSVLSALARMNVDPWDEATRLAAMPKAVAERTLVSILDLVSGRKWNPSEAEVVAARLVRLLPQRGDAATIAAADAARVGARRTNYWWVWVVFAIAISLLSPRHHATTTDVGASASKSSATSPLKSGSTNSTSPGANGQSH
jgi:hypothetical protein